MAPCITDGGFGGCVVSLLLEYKIAEVREKIAAEYQARTGLTADIDLCHSGAWSSSKRLILP